MTEDPRWAAAQAAYQGKVRTFARNSAYAIPGFDEVDVEQELLVVLWECAIHYDPNKGATFNTYFQRSAKNRIITLIRRANTKGRSADIVHIEEDSVGAAVDDVFSPSTQSAETMAFLSMELDEVLAANPGALNRTRGRRKQLVRAA